MIETQEIHEPPKPPMSVATSSDYIENLGDQIAALTQKEAMELTRYLEELGAE